MLDPDPLEPEPDDPLDPMPEELEPDEPEEPEPEVPLDEPECGRFFLSVFELDVPEP